MNSPTQLSGVQQRLAQSSSPYFQIALYAAGNVLAVAILLLVWFGWGILAAFQEPLLWAWLCSLSLRDVKRFLVSTARRELLSSSFIVCCGKLVFLPAVIAWQVFDEVRDKLQAKYHELQTNSQATCQHSTAACAGAPATAAGDVSAPAAGSYGSEDTPGSMPAHSDPPAALNTNAAGSAVNAASAGAQRQQPKGSQVLRQRKAASKQQQSHNNNNPQRPPLGPRSNSTPAAAAAAAQKQGVAAATRHKAAAGAPAAPGAKSNSMQGHRKQQQGSMAKGKAASPLQQRLLRLRDFVRQLFSSYGFITMELLRFILGGLLPRRPSADQPQQQQRQQQQQQQQTRPGLGLANSTLPAASLRVGPSHVGLSPYLDANSTSIHSAAGTASLVEGSSGSARSECSMPWAPHPHWQQLMRQQQQQQQGMLSMQQQQQQSQGRRLSSSSSTPSLQQSAAASQQASPRAAGSSSGGVGAGVVPVDPAGINIVGLERHMTSPAVPDAGHSFSGWAGMLQPQPVSRCGSVSSCTASQHSAAAAAVGWAQHNNTAGDSSPSGSATALQQQQHFQQQQHSMAAMQTAASPTPASLPGTLPVPLAVSGHHTPALFLSGQLPLHTQSLGLLGNGAYEGSSSGVLLGGYWEGLGPPRSPPGSTTGVAAGSSGGSSPSAVLFKGLLRGIVLYEGYRYVQGFLAAEQSLFIPLLALGLSLALAGGLPFLLLPASLLKPTPASDSSTPGGTHTPRPQGSNSHGGRTAGAAAAAGAAHRQDSDRAAKNAAQAAAGSQRVRNPFSDAAAGDGDGEASAATPSKPAAAGGAGAAGPAKPASLSSSGGTLSRAWCRARQQCAVVWLRTVSVLVRADTALRTGCASGFLDTAVSGLIVVGLILGSVVLTAVLLVQVGDESRQAVVSLNTLVRQKGTEAGLTEGVWSLVQQYEGQLVGMTQYVLQEALPGLTHYVENRASAFLISHNMSKVLIDWEMVRTALKLPADCGDDARLRLAVQLANSSLSESQLGQQRQQLQQQLLQQQKRLGVLAAELETLWINGSSNGTAGGSSTAQGPLGGSGGGVSTPTSSNSSNSSVLAQEVLEVQSAVDSLQEQLHSAVVAHEAASEQLKLAELRMHNCQPASASSSGAAAGLANAAQERGLLANLLGGFTAGKASDITAAGDTAAAESQSGRAMSHPGPGMTNPMSHVRGVLAAMARLDFTAVGHEATAMLGQLMPEDEEAPQQQEENEEERAQNQQHSQQQQLQLEKSCSFGEEGPQGAFGAQGQPLLTGDGRGADQCPSNNTCSVNSSLGCTQEPQGSSTTAAVAVTKQGRSKGSSGKGSSSGSGSGTSLVRVARGAAYPLITMLRHVSSVVVTGLGSTTAVALGTGLGVLRLGLGVAKFLVQLGVFASVLYTLLALDIDPVEQLVKLLPISEASQDRASRAVTKALRGVFVSSLKLAAFHAGFTWLTLRAFGTHFVCTATAASAIVAVLPLVPVYLTVLPAVLELGLVRGAAVKGLVLLALHVGAYTFGDDLIYREIEPTLPYLVGLGVFGGMWHFANPLQGVLLGPMVLALLSVGYNLHREML